MRFLGIGVRVSKVGGSAADVKQPQAVLPTKHLTLTLLPVSPGHVFRPFCSYAIGVLRHLRGETEVDVSGVLRS